VLFNRRRREEEAVRAMEEARRLAEEMGVVKWSIILKFRTKNRFSHSLKLT
jgi:hypothetical protein